MSKAVSSLCFEKEAGPKLWEITQQVLLGLGSLIKYLKGHQDLHLKIIKMWKPWQRGSKQLPISPNCRVKATSPVHHLVYAHCQKQQGTHGTQAPRYQQDLLGLEKLWCVLKSELKPVMTINISQETENDIFFVRSNRIWQRLFCSCFITTIRSAAVY